MFGWCCLVLVTACHADGCPLTCSGVLRAAEDIKIAQLHTTALDTIAVLLKATEGGQQLTPELQTSIQKQLSTMIAEHKASAVKAQAQDILALLHNRTRDNIDIDMNDAGHV